MATGSPDSKGKAELRIYFVGGTVFIQNDAHCTAVQLSGHNFELCGHSMRHRSFLVAPSGTFKGAHKFPKEYPKLHGDMASGMENYEVICLVGKDVRISHAGEGDFTNECKKLAKLDGLSKWQTLNSLVPGEDAAVNSRFTITGGKLTDGDPVDPNGSVVKWRIGDGEFKDISDVAVLKVVEENITISGLHDEEYTVAPSQTPLKLYVFAGAESRHGAPGSRYSYWAMSHAILLSTIFDLEGTPIADIIPVAQRIVISNITAVTPHPCDVRSGVKVKTRGVSGDRIYPDTEYCSNVGGG